MTNALLPIQQKYNALNQEQRYQFRKLCRTFVKWYGYITQIARMFDKQMHDEYIFCSYLAKVIPADPTTPFDLGDRVKLEYYNLEKTYEGSIGLVKEEKGVYEPAKLKKPVKMSETQLFDDAAQEAYVESTETYTKLFEDAGKYRAIMSALAQAMFDEMKNEKL